MLLVFCNLLEGEVRCLSESMETWIHSAKGEELEAWLSEALQIKGDSSPNTRKHKKMNFKKDKENICF